MTDHPLQLSRRDLFAVAGGVVEGPELPNDLVGRPAEIDRPLPEPEGRRLG